MRKSYIKQYNLSLLLTAVVMFVTMGTVAHAGVGILEEDEQMVSTGLSFSASNSHWNANRNVITSICKRRNAGLGAGYEYGWSYFHTVYASTGLAYRRCGQTGLRGGGLLVSGRAMGLGDVEIGVRTRFGGNYLNTAAWEAALIIPTGYDNNSPSALGRGALGLALGVKFSSDPSHRYPYKWGFSSRKWAWKAGSKYTYFFSSKGSSLSSFVSLQHAFTDSDFERTGDFVTVKLNHSVGFSNGGVQQRIFINQTPSAMTSSDQVSIELKYSHSFNEGLSASATIGKSLFGRNNPRSLYGSLGASYRWRD